MAIPNQSFDPLPVQRAADSVGALQGRGQGIRGGRRWQQRQPQQGSEDLPRQERRWGRTRWDLRRHDDDEGLKHKTSPAMRDQTKHEWKKELCESSRRPADGMDMQPICWYAETT